MSRKTILVIDDDPDQREIYRVVLLHAGYDVLAASNAVEGMRLAAKHQPALIVMDIALPVVDGWEAARLLKLDPSTARIPIIGVSARQLFPGQDARVRESGLECYLLKPIEPRQMLAEVARHIGPSPGPDA